MATREKKTFDNPIEENAHLKKIIKRKNLIIGSLSTISIVLIGVITLLNNPPTSQQDAPSKVSAWRKPTVLPFMKKAYGIYWDTDDIQSYLTDFDNNVKTTGMKPYNDVSNPPQGYKWSIGFYWEFKPDITDGSKIKLSYCMVPTLVSKSDPKDIKDYFNSNNNQYYDHSNDMTPNANAKDNGQLWP
jgi:hypothetical protein